MKCCPDIERVINVSIVWYDFILFYSMEAIAIAIFLWLNEVAQKFRKEEPKINLSTAILWFIYLCLFIRFLILVF